MVFVVLNKRNKTFFSHYGQGLLVMCMGCHKGCLHSCPLVQVSELTLLVLQQLQETRVPCFMPA